MPDDLDRIGLAEREIEHDEFRRFDLEIREQRGRRRELAGLETDRGQNLAHQRPHLRLVVEDEREPPGRARTRL